LHGEEDISLPLNMTKNLVHIKDLKYLIHPLLPFKLPPKTAQKTITKKRFRFIEKIPTFAG
jgi:hypothetical protein